MSTFAEQHEGTATLPVQRIVWRIRTGRASGYTINVDTGATPTDGYVVSREGCEQTVSVEDLTTHWLRAYVDAHPALHEPNAYLGLWVADGKVYADVSEHVASLTHAVAYGRSRGQLAIFDVRNVKTIWLEGQES